MTVMDSAVAKQGTVFLPLRFGAGLHTSKDEGQIDASECAVGSYNFDLGIDSTSWKPRPAFDLAATAPNAAEIRGFCEYIASDGSVSLLVQAGGNVYDWDGESTFSLVGTVPAGSKIRGNRFSTSVLDGYVIITDLEQQATVRTYDGTTFSELSTSLSGDFLARYCLVDKERAMFAGVKSGGTQTDHVVVASAVSASISASAVGTLSTSNRPSSSLGTGDAFYIPMPDLKPVNGILAAFGLILISTENGSVYKLTGSDAKDYALDPFYPDSASSGREAMVTLYSDVLFGPHGRIESLVNTQAFGDVEPDDVSRWVSDQFEDVQGWTIKYNPRTRKAYLWAENGNEVWVFHKSVFDRNLTTGGNVSPWSKYVTDFGDGDFRQTAAEVLRHPASKLDYTYFGNASGQIFRMEGVGIQDGGTTDVVSRRISGRIECPWTPSVPVDHSLGMVNGYVRYKKSADATLTMTALRGGVELNDNSVTKVLDGFADADVFSGDAWFGGDFYFGVQFDGRVAQQSYQFAGRSQFFQLQTSITGAEFEVPEIGVQFEVGT